MKTTRCGTVATAVVEASEETWVGMMSKSPYGEQRACRDPVVSDNLAAVAMHH